MPPDTPHHPDNPDDPTPPTGAAGGSAPRFVVDGEAAGFLSARSQDGGGRGESAEPGRLVELDADQSRHALRALRLSVGDAVCLLDGRGAVARARVETAEGGRVSCVVESVARHAPASPQITLATAIPKGPRGDAMSNDLAQLGADLLVPMTTARSVVVPGASKLSRYHKQAAEAAKQCGRSWFMDVAPLAGFAQVLARYAETDAEVGGATLKLLADPAGEPTSAVAPRLAGAASVVVLVGPEGGFTDAEARAARDAGFVPWRFAPHVLRVETAAAAAVAVLRSLA